MLLLLIYICYYFILLYVILYVIIIEFIQGLSKEIARVFHEIIQGIWSEGKIYENWTLTRIIPIHKADDENDVRSIGEWHY